MDANSCDVASTNWGHWHGIPWQDVHREVGRLQARIAKAAKAGEWRTARRLQRLLTRSESAKALAVRRVTENRGRNTPGIDRQTWSTPESKWEALVSLGKDYRPKPLRRVYIPKSNGERRPLGIPTMTDRAMQALHLLALDPIAEVTGDKHSYGFRRERSTTDAIEQVRNALGRRHSPTWVLEGDIKGCSDNISHDWLQAHVCMDKRLLRRWLKAGYFEGRHLFPTPSGTPQGGIISPVLANLALDGLQHELDGLFRTVRESRHHKVNYVRYADDFVITASSKEFLATTVKPLVQRFLAERGLTLSDTKTVITQVTDGFDFLGWTVRKRGSILLTTPATKNQKNFKAKIVDALRTRRTAKQEDVIDALNPVLRGWAEYHRTQMATRTFAKMDHFLFGALWRWACRRHPNKGKRWIKDRYWRRINGRDWLFATKDKLLLTLGSFHKKRHVKVNADANPYLPSDELYFDKRLAQKMSSSIAGRRRLAWLWHQQDGTCPKCLQRITRDTGWHTHHIVKRTDGGSDQASNLMLLHPFCHHQIHAETSYK
jgi:RNA-directed DNA polymerase